MTKLFVNDDGIANIIYSLDDFKGTFTVSTLVDCVILDNPLTIVGVIFRTSSAVVP